MFSGRKSLTDAASTPLTSEGNGNMQRHRALCHQTEGSCELGLKRFLKISCEEIGLIDERTRSSNIFFERRECQSNYGLLQIVMHHRSLAIMLLG